MPLVTVGLRSVLVAAGTAVVLAVSPAVATAAPARTVPLPAGIQPEGIETSGTAYWVGSLGNGRIVAGDVRDVTPPRVLLPGANGRQLRGLAYDPRTALLWAVGNVGTVGHVWAVDTRSGRVEADIVVRGSVFLNDLVIVGNAVWVTDSRVQRLTRITLTATGRPTAVSPAFLPLTGDWPAAPAGENAANGIRALPNNRVVLDNSTAGGLWVVPLATGVARAVPVTGGAITGGDGLELRGSTLWVVRGIDDASVSQLQLTVGTTTVSAAYTATLRAPSLDVPSTASFTAGALYAVNARFGVTSPETASYAITRLPVDLTAAPSPTT